jgi:hypothetical protein
MRLSGNRDVKHFVEEAASVLDRLPGIPDWAEETDQNLPISRHFDHLSYVLIKGDPNTPISFGDQFEAKVHFCPLIRLDGNIIVLLKKDGNHVVVRMVDGVQSLITGLKAKLLIRQAKNAIPRDQRVRPEIIIVHECCGVFGNNNHSFKIVGQPRHNLVKF